MKKGQTSGREGSKPAGQHSIRKLAATCGLCCEACNLYIATTDDPDRLARLSQQFQIPEEELRCYGCRAEKRGPYCQVCTMSSCALGRGIDFCSECDEYPCGHLVEFQAELPHRRDLWRDLEAIKRDGCACWRSDVLRKYECPECGTVNSAYDLGCRSCGHEPSCAYVAQHGEAIRAFLKSL